MHYNVNGLHIESQEVEWGGTGGTCPHKILSFLQELDFLQYKSVLLDYCAPTFLSKFSRHCMKYLVLYYIAKKSHSLCYLFSIISACNIPCKLITNVYIGQCAWDLHAALVMYSSKFCSIKFCDLPWFCIMIFSVKSFTLNCSKGILSQMHTWFLEIAFVCSVHYTHACVWVCAYVYLSMCPLKGIHVNEPCKF